MESTEHVNITVNPDLPELFSRIESLKTNLSDPDVRSELTALIEQTIARLKSMTKVSLEAHQKIADNPSASEAVKAQSKQTLIGILQPIDEKLAALDRLISALNEADLAEVLKGMEAINRALEAEIALKRKQA